MEQTEQDFRDIERRYQEPPDEPHPRYEDEPDDDEEERDDDGDVVT